MSRVLIVYFSRTGATRRVAAALAMTLHADVEPMRHDLSAYQMVVIGRRSGRAE